MAQKVLVFGDIGIDDTMALIYSYFNDDIDIVGIVADYGNVTKEKAVANVKYIESMLGGEKVKQVTIMGGAEIPMTGDIPVPFPEIHGEFGLGPIIPPENFKNNGVLENFFEVVNIVHTYENLIVVNIGRLTSLATMFILYPNLIQKIKAYYIMGGAFWVPGNVTAVSEANFYEDPIAANIVLSYADNLTIIPLDVTQRAIVTPDMVDYIDQHQPLTFIKPMMDYYYDFYKKRTPSIQGSPMHDVLAMMAIEEEDMFTFATLPLHIVQDLGGVTQGESIVDIRSYADLDNSESDQKYKKYRIAFQLDYQKFFTKFMSVMTGRDFN